MSGSGGDKQAENDQVLAEYEGRLLRYAAHLTGSVETARDVVQETFLRYLRASPQEAEKELGPYLFAICRNCALDGRRRSSAMRARHEKNATMSPATSSNPDQQAARPETRSALMQALSELPESQQEVIRLKFQEAMSYRQIARITGKTISNVGFLLHAGLKAIRARLASQPAEMCEIARTEQ